MASQGSHRLEPQKLFVYSQTNRRSRLLRVPLHLVWQELHQVVQGQPGCLHSAGSSVGVLQVSLRFDFVSFKFKKTFPLQTLRALGQHIRERINSSILIGELLRKFVLESRVRLSPFPQGRVDCIRSASTEALEWAKAMCQGEGANVALESDKEDEEDEKKVTFSIYSVSLHFAEVSVSSSSALLSLLL